MFSPFAAAAVFALLIASFVVVDGQTAAERDIAATYAPIFRQALGDRPRGDYPTNFNFDGDWDGTNNWKHAEDNAYKLRGYIYYSVAETETHYFITYAVFHARDYKGGDTKGVIYSDLLRDGARILSKGKEPTGLLAEAAIAHENDMEGALVVVDKKSGEVAFIETLHHNSFSRYTPIGSEIQAEGHFGTSDHHVELYVEPKGHGIEALGTEGEHSERGYLIYSYAGRAEDPETSADKKVGYELLPIAAALWPRARTTSKNATFANIKNYGSITISLVAGGKTLEKKVALGDLASAFSGKVGGVNMARPPWGWFSNDHRDDPPGTWFFDPAKTVKRDFALSDSFSTAYIKVPFWAAGSAK